MQNEGKGASASEISEQVSVKTTIASRLFQKQPQLSSALVLWRSEPPFASPGRIPIWWPPRSPIKLQAAIEALHDTRAIQEIHLAEHPRDELAQRARDAAAVDLAILEDVAAADAADAAASRPTSAISEVKTAGTGTQHRRKTPVAESPLPVQRSQTRRVPLMLAVSNPQRALKLSFICSGDRGHVAAGQLHQLL